MSLLILTQGMKRRESGSVAGYLPPEEVAQEAVNPGLELLRLPVKLRSQVKLFPAFPPPKRQRRHPPSPHSQEGAEAKERRWLYIQCIVCEIPVL